MTACAPETGETVSDELDQARRCVARTHEALAAQPMSPHTAHAAVEGVHRLAGALAGLVAALMDQLPAAVDGNGGGERNAAGEVMADLRAMHGCLTTGVLLLDPALEDLRALAAPATTTDGEMPMTRDQPTGDVADQQVPADPDENPAQDVREVTEADPADVADQRRLAREQPSLPGHRG